MFPRQTTVLLSSALFWIVATQASPAPTWTRSYGGSAWPSASGHNWPPPSYSSGHVWPPSSSSSSSSSSAVPLSSGGVENSTTNSTDTQQCRRTKVVVLGAGIAGITAAQQLALANISDFIIVEYTSSIGGRVAHTTFGNDSNGNPYVVELGANWVQGTATDGGPSNPIWTLAQKWNLTNTYSNYSDILTYDQSGYNDYSDLLSNYEDAYATLEQDAGTILVENLQDRSVRSGLRLADWNPARDAQKQAVEWWEWDWEFAFPPEQSSQVFGIVNYNTTFYQFSADNNYVFDQRGFNAFIIGEASTFLAANDSRLLLETVVTNISYSDTGVTITNEDGSCVSADYAICTFSLGVLQNQVVDFEPRLPDWKEAAIASFAMGTYTKIFLQFNETFWPEATQFLLYADPATRGYYPVFQSLSTPGFIEGSNIIFVTVVDQQSYTVEAQSDEETKEQVMGVLRTMFPDIIVPEPTAFMYPRWSEVPWAYGSYSNWPVGTSLQSHQNLRANVGRLWFAGEATSSEYYGFLHGAYFEGEEVGGRIAELVLGEQSCAVGNETGAYCGVGEVHYEVLQGVTPEGEYDIQNGWDVSSFQTVGDV
ncbi:hypothetical protein LTR78_006803 [Recurvomyces mirabilis]|uniref:Amine oxidase n=1 Tax=Recurvomyces mirabilis TaxID=574656 RepID=A0AAE0WK84_9PEZI|nr:hypothetical protein LTR78_006803 [Recurvomyces mirabilis]KAK5153207.1 hypothetical protein LTS14_007852 [Recurvomyces mirabilis]